IYTTHDRKSGTIADIRKNDELVWHLSRISPGAKVGGARQLPRKHMHCSESVLGLRFLVRIRGRRKAQLFQDELQCTAELCAECNIQSLTGGGPESTILLVYE